MLEDEEAISNKRTNELCVGYIDMSDDTSVGGKWEAVRPATFPRQKAMKARRRRVERGYTSIL